jgi:hypothetical protein
VISSSQNFLFISWCGVRLSPLGILATFEPTAPASDDDDDGFEAGDGMRIGRRNRSTQRKGTPVLLCPL